MEIKFTPQTPLALAYPPEPIKKVIPEWYKELDNTAVKKNMFEVDGLKPVRTIKRCVPVQDYLTSGYVIKNICDIKLARGLLNQGTKEVVHTYAHLAKEAELPVLSTHLEKQFPLYLDGIEKTMLKFNNFFTIKTPPGYSCLFYQPFYLFESRFTILPAIVDTDTFEEPVSFPFYINNRPESEYEIFIEAGAPLMCVLPFKRDEWNMTIGEPVRDFNNKIVKPLTKAQMIFTSMMENAYRKVFHKKKKFN